MKKSDKIRQQDEKRKGGAAALKKLLPRVASKKQLCALGDDRYLAMMTRAINQAGFNWKVIENKWPQFEEAFFGFDPNKLGLLSPEQWEAYTSDRRVVRNWQKIKALSENVFFVQEESLKHGGFGRFIANWPASDQVGLMNYLKKHGSRLGGQSALWFLRTMGKDCFILARDVVITLQQAGVDISDKPASQKDLRLAQEAFNAWHEATGLPYSHLSRIAAYATGDNYL